MDRAENTGQKLGGRRFALQLHQFLVQPVQVLVALDKKIVNDFIHRLIRSRVLIEPCARRNVGSRLASVSTPHRHSRRRLQSRARILESEAGRTSVWSLHKDPNDGRNADRAVGALNRFGSRDRWTRLKPTACALTLEACTRTLMARAVPRRF